MLSVIRVQHKFVDLFMCLV